MVVLKMFNSVRERNINVLTFISKKWYYIYEM